MKPQDNQRKLPVNSIMLEAKMGTTGCNLSFACVEMVTVWLVLALVTVSQFHRAAGQGLSPAGEPLGEQGLDPNSTMEQLQKVVSMISTTENFYPGLVAFQRWQDPLQNHTVVGRVLLWTPDCSMEWRDGEYNLSGLLISNRTSESLHSPAFQKFIVEGSPSATLSTRNMWLDYFSKPAQGSEEILPPPALLLDGVNSNDTSIFGVCIPSNNTRVIDSLISGSNERWSTLYSEEFLMSTDSKYIVEMQTDCNLVVYTYPERRALWASNTYLAGTNCTAVMQTDGNMVVYNGNRTSLFSTKSYLQGFVGSFRFTMQKDGRAVVYNMESGQILWVSYRFGL